MDRLELQDLKREAVRIRRKLDKITDRKEKARALKTYAKLLNEIIEIRKVAEKPVMLIRSE